MNSCEILSECLLYLKDACKDGVATSLIDQLAKAFVEERGGKCFNKGYKPIFSPIAYPYHICISLNDEISHGLPSDEKIIHAGDLVNIDMSVIKDGEVADSAISFGVGEIGDEEQKLLRLALRALQMGAKKVKRGALVLDVAKAIESTVYMAGYVVNHRFIGHGIGKTMHMGPEIPHFVAPMISQELVMKYYTPLQVGQRICLEPHITRVDEWGIIQPDGWAYKTKNHEKSAMFEVMLEVTEDGYKQLTNHITL